jgi:hypothetical protein
MTGLLGESLAKRARIVRAIEQSDDPDGDASRDSMALVEALRTAATGASSPSATSGIAEREPLPEASIGASALPSSAQATPPAKRRAPIAIAAFALLVLIGVAAFARSRASSDAAPASIEPSAAAPTTSAVAPTAPTASVAVVASAAATVEPAAPKASAAPAATVAKGPVVARPAVSAAPAAAKPAAKSANCKNPFVLDADGTTHVKRECL